MVGVKDLVDRVMVGLGGSLQTLSFGLAQLGKGLRMMQKSLARIVEVAENRTVVLREVTRDCGRASRALSLGRAGRSQGRDTGTLALRCLGTTLGLGLRGLDGVGVRTLGILEGCVGAKGRVGISLESSVLIVCLAIQDGVGSKLKGLQQGTELVADLPTR